MNTAFSGVTQDVTPKKLIDLAIGSDLQRQFAKGQDVFINVYTNALPIPLYIGHGTREKAETRGQKSFCRYMLVVKPKART